MHPTLFDLSPGSRDLLEQLWSWNAIGLARDSVLDRTPDPLDVSRLQSEARVEGMLLGIAAGDALGHSTEWRFEPATRYEKFGTILDHVPDSRGRFGRISDDTQMSFWTVERLLARGRFDFDDLVSCFVNRRNDIVGRGKNTAAALDRHHSRLQTGTPSLVECAGDIKHEGRGNGGLMRIAPIVLPHLTNPSASLWADSVLATYATHGHTVSLAASVGFIDLLWQILRRPAGDAPDSMWWLDRYVATTRGLETEPLPHPLYTQSSAVTASAGHAHPIPKWFHDFEGTLWQFVDGPVRDAFRNGIPLRDACSLEGFGSRADCVQTVPACLYTLMCHADSFESAVIASVNDTKDNDTIAAIVGAIVGALHGKAFIRPKWIEGIQSTHLKCNGCEGLSDREAVKMMATQAAQRFTN